MTKLKFFRLVFRVANYFYLRQFLIVLVLRVPAQHRMVRVAPALLPPKRALSLDLAVCLGAGLLAAGYNRVAFGFTKYSAALLMIGCAIAGFFIGLDSALFWERRMTLH